MPSLQLGPLLSSLAESQYKNDEQFDNALRSVLFQVPVPGNPACVQGPDVSPCFNGVVDLAAIDIERARDHGIGTYNQLRQAYGLPARTSFTGITGEAPRTFPSDPLLTAGNEINDPNILDYTRLSDLEGGADHRGQRRRHRQRAAHHHRLAAAGNLRQRQQCGRLRRHDRRATPARAGIRGTAVGDLDPSVPGARDGDRFYYGNDQDCPQSRTSTVSTSTPRWRRSSRGTRTSLWPT